MAGTVKASPQLLLRAPVEKAPAEWIRESDEIRTALAEICELEVQVAEESETAPLIVPSHRRRYGT
jgi:hypothetical protein